MLDGFFPFSFFFLLALITTGTRIAIGGGPAKSGAICSVLPLEREVFNAIGLVAYALADRHYN